MAERATLAAVNLLARRHAVQVARQGSLWWAVDIDGRIHGPWIRLGTLYAWMQARGWERREVPRA